MNIAYMKIIKKRWIANAESNEIIGKRLTLKTTFFTRNVLEIILFVPADRPSAKKNHGKIPEINHKIKGKSPTGFDLKPTWNTNQKMSTVTVGWMKAQKIPRKFPMYFCLKSFLVNDHKSLWFWIIALKKSNNSLSPYTKVLVYYI